MKKIKPETNETAEKAPTEEGRELKSSELKKIRGGWSSSYQASDFPNTAASWGGGGGWSDWW